MTRSLDFASFIHTPKKIALRLAIFAALSLVLMFGVMRWSAKGAFGITPTPIPQVTFTTSLQLAYYNQDNDWDSTVVLNNNAKDERFISITLYGKDGQALNVPVFSIPANSIKRFKVIDWTLGANNFREGNINVAFNGKPMEITGQVSVVNSRDRLEFESKPSMPMDYSSKRLNGIVTLPERQAKAYVALTNTSNNPIEVSLTSDAEHVHADKVNLLAHETKVEEIKMKNGDNSPLSALVTLTHNGVVSALITTAYAINKQTGFTSNLYFYDDAKTVSNRLAGAHFRFGDANPTEGFPAGTVFKAPLVLANLGTASTTATVTVDYTKNGQAKLQSIGSFPVPSRGVKEIELQAALAALGVTGPVDNAGVDIRYTGTTGTLIGQLTSASTNGDYSFDVPMKDPLISMNRTSGSYPFRLDGNYNTVLHLKNMSDKKVRAVVQVRYEGGTYHPEQLNLEPFQTVAVDIKKFQSQQTLDIRGNVFPANITSGKIIWTERDVASVIGRAETINLSAGIAGSFSCPWCSCPPHHGYFSMEYISPFNGFSVVGDAGYSLRGWEHLISCDEIEAWGPYWVSGYALNWSSSNAGVASIAADGWIQCLTPGWTSIGGSYFTMTATDNNSPNCDETYSVVTGQAPVQVHKVQITKDGQDVTNQTIPVIVGQKMNLDLIVDDISTTNGQWTYSWTVPGSSSAEKTAIKLYEPTVDLGKVTLLAQADLNSKAITFYWVEGSFAGTEKIVNASVTIGGQVFSVSTKFSVKSPRPKANGEVNATALGVNAIGVYPGLFNALYLSYGNDNASPSQYGITATADFEVPSPFQGSFHWIQKVSTTRKRLNNSGTLPWNVCTGFGLDAGVGGNTAFENGATFTDGPAITVDNGQLRQIVQDQFTTWYMFKPSGSDSIYVPLRKFDWFWNADYARNPSTNQWTRTSASVSVQNPAVQNTTGYFEWTTKIPPANCTNRSTQF